MGVEQVMPQGAQVASQLGAGLGDGLAEGRRVPVAVPLVGDVAAGSD
jgi:hypothetical protein